MNKFTDIFLLIYTAKTDLFQYEELCIFLDLTFNQLISVFNTLREFEFVYFDNGRFYITEKGLKQIEKYDLDSFDFSDGIKLIEKAERYQFKNENYLPLDFYIKYKIEQ